MILFKSFLINLAIALALVFMHGRILRLFKKPTALSRICSGLIFALASVAAMAEHFTLTAGVIFDARSVIISTCGLFCGPLAVMITAAIAGIYRYSIGGEGLAMGCVVIAGSAAIGVGFHYLARSIPRIRNAYGLYAMGLTVHGYMLAAMGLLPEEVLPSVFKTVAPTVLLVLPIGNILLGLLIVEQEYRKTSDKKHRENEKLLASIISNTPHAISWKDMHLRYLGCNTQFAREIGLENPKDVIGKTDEQLAENQPEIKRYQQGDLKILTEGVPLCNMESRYVGTDGDERILLTSKIPLTNTQNHMIGVLGIHMDVTEQKQYETTLKASQKILNETGRMAKIGGWEHDLPTGKALWTRALYDIIEIDPNDSPPGVHEHWDYYPPEDRQTLQRAMHKAIHEGIAFDLELQVHTATGKLLWCRAFGEPVFKNGRCTKVRGTFQDITQRKDIERKLADSEAMFRRFVENADDVIYALAMDSTFSYVSPNCKRLIGHEPDEIMGKPYAWIVHPDDLAACNAAFAKLTGQGGTYEGLQHRVRYHDGRYAWNMSNLSALTDSQGNITGCVGISRDIHEQKLIAEQLKANEIRLRELIDHMRSAVVVYQPTDDGMDFIFKECNDAMLRIEQCTEKDILGKPVTEVFPGVEGFGFLAVLRRIHRTGKAEHFGDKYYHDGRIAGWRDCYAYKLPSGEIVTIYDDVTERKNAEQNIKNANKFAQSILNGMHEILAVIRPEDLVIENVNAAFLKTYGVAEKDCIGKTCHHVFHGQCERSSGLDAYCPIGETFRTGRDQYGEYVHETPNARKIFIEASTTPMTDDQGNITRVLYVGRDITERKMNEQEKIQLQQQLRQAQKMKAIGTLAGGIAHDFNNILGALTGYAEMVRDDLCPGTPAHDNQNEVLTAANRAAKLVKQILTFSRNEQIRYEPVDINAVTAEVLRMINGSLPESIVLHQDIHGSVVINGDTTQLHQVVLNLLTNAVGAMEAHGGDLTIATEEVNLDAGCFIRNGTRHQGPYVKLTVTDSGCGMNATVLERIFEPFFTTKAVGKGTGLGLSVVHGIVESHGGFIDVTSTLHKGTTMAVYLPRPVSLDVTVNDTQQHFDRVPKG